MLFKLTSPYKPSGDQPNAIRGLASGLQQKMDRQTLLGVTGSGKTFTVANVIEKVQKPTLVIAHNKTLAAQLCNEFREFFPDNAVEYFVSFYDYYQPEAYMPGTDTYIEKEAQINDEIDRLRHACTQALLSRKDVIVVASVSAIYNLGSPKEYEQTVLHLRKGQELDRRGMLEQLVEMQFERTNADLTRGTFRMRGQVFEIMPVNEEKIYRFDVGKYIEHIEVQDPVSRKTLASSDNEHGGPSTSLRTNVLSDVWFFPAKHHVASPALRERAFKTIRTELDEQLAMLERKGKVLEHERLKRRVTYDLELINNLGYCNGIENYSRHFDGRAPGEPPFTLLDYFAHCDDEFLTIIDESHVTLPQVRGMFHGDRARKDTLIEHGFRLPSARDNRPLMFDEFETRTKQTIYVSATPNDYEKHESTHIVEQIVRPTGLVDPEVIVHPVMAGKKIPLLGKEGLGVVDTHAKSTPSKLPLSKGESSKSQVDDVIVRIQDRIAKGERTLVTTLTKKMAEDLTDYLEKKRIRVKYLHSDIQTLERIEVITALRKGDIDVIVGVNLLREGLDMPEVSLVAILDADKEGFLRSETSLIQTIGRAARNVNGQVVVYADTMTGSLQRAIDETQRRREIQLAYNKTHGITPKTIEKNIRNILEEFGITPGESSRKKKGKGKRSGTLELDLLGDARPIKEIIKDKEKKMKEAATRLEFELAAILRDEVRELKARERVK